MSVPRSPLNLQFPKISYLNIKIALISIVMGIAVGVAGFMLLEDYNFREALYMTMITISTVGFGEVRPLSPAGQIFTIALLIINVAIFAYSISVFSELVIEGELFKKLHLRTIQKRINHMKDHIILCGYGRYGKEVAANLISHGVPFILIDNDLEAILSIQNNAQEIIYINGDATTDEALLKAQIKEARALITTLADDTDNLFTVLSARQLNPALSIISSTRDMSTETKLKRAGADHVILPNKLGGFYMANLISKPGTVEFFSLISNDLESDIGFDEFRYEQVHHSIQGKSLGKLQIRECTGANIIGFKNKDGSFTVNPENNILFETETSIIAIGSRTQLANLKVYMMHPHEFPQSPTGIA